MANIRLYQFPTKASPVPADIVYLGDSAAAFDEVQCTIAELIGAYPNLTSLAGLTPAAGDIVYTTGSAFALLAAGTSGQILKSNGAAPPSWSTATFPSTAGAAGNVLISNGTNYVASTSLWPNTVGAAGKILRSDGTTNAYSTATYPDVATSTGSMLYANGTNWVASTSLWPNTVGSAGKILRSDGTTNAYTTATFADTYAVNTLLYAASANAVSGLATVTTAVLTTSSGVPTWAAQLSLALGGTNASLTAANGAIPYSTATALALLAPGTSGQLLQSGGAGAPAWTTATYPATAGTANNVIKSDGTNFSSATLSSIMDAVFGSAQGDILYRNASAWTVLAPGTAGFVLKTGGAGADPSWTNIEGVSVVPTVQTFLSGSGTYTTPAGVFYIKVTCVGGGGGGGGSATQAANDGAAGTTGSDTTFSTLTAQGGVGGSNTATVTGGTGGGGVNGDVNQLGVNGGATLIGGVPNGVTFMGGNGGGSAFFGGGGIGSSQITGAGVAGVANTGGGGAGGICNFISGKSGTGGGGGGSLWKIISSPAATYSYSVGGGGAGGAAGTGGYAGGAGGSGIIIVEEFYQ